MFDQVEYVKLKKTLVIQSLTRKNIKFSSARPNFVCSSKFRSGLVCFPNLDFVCSSKFRLLVQIYCHNPGGATVGRPAGDIETRKCRIPICICSRDTRDNEQKPLSSTPWAQKTKKNPSGVTAKAHVWFCEDNAERRLPTDVTQQSATAFDQVKYVNSSSFPARLSLTTLDNKY